ncbi:MAG TPA: ribonuclease J [Candidatus Magasanikbacteria bacterium]|nr:ribonuclease J [Candidatus Magasanikbacteria bacterium]
MEATVKSNNNRRRRSYHTKRSSSPVGRNSGRVFAAQPVNKNQSDKTETKSYPFNPNGNEKLRIIPLGGQEEVGRNMTVFEYAGDIVILDMGIQFPEEDMPGIDYIIPNTKYLIGKEKNIKGVIFSHGHLDHIGAAPILLEKLGNPVIAGRDLTLAMIKHKMEDYKKGSASTLKIVQIKGIHDVIRMGRFTIKFFQVEHSIMDAVGVIIETPSGTVVHPGDWALERDKSGRPTLDYSHLQNLKKPTVLMLESLGSIHFQRSGNYEDMHNNLFNILQGAAGRVIIGTFSSQIERIKWILEAADKLGKKVALDGYSMKMNIDLAKELGYIKVKKGLLIESRKIDNYPDNEIVVICTGAQGEENAVLTRIVNREHRSIKLKKQDTVIFSSSIIPGNERSIQRLKDNMYRQCDNVIHGELMDVHVSGHATRDDIVEMIRMIRPTYFMPVYGNHYFLKEAEKLVIQNGFDKNKIFVADNGSVIEINIKEGKILEKKVPSDYVFVDGLGISDSQHIVLRDRQVLAEDGMVVVIVTVDSHTGKLIQNPDIISRGFVFLKDNKELIEDLRHKVRKWVTDSNPLSWVDSNEIRNTVRDKVGQFLFTKTEKRPMVLPVVIEV